MSCEVRPLQPRRPLRTVMLPMLLPLALTACQPDLANQPKYKVYAPASTWADGASARPLVKGTVAQGAIAERARANQPPAADAALLARGRERFDIFCSPCHGRDGTGSGRVVERGFPQPPSYFSQRLRQAPARHFFDVITHGYGVMYSYADRVAVWDRWAIVAYIRALQRANPLVSRDLPTRSAVPVGLPGGRDER